MVTKVFLDSKS